MFNLQYKLRMAYCCKPYWTRRYFILLVYELYINLKRLFQYSNTNITMEDRKSTLVNLLVSVLIFSLSLCFL